MLLDQTLDALEFGSRESSAVLEPNRIEPELRHHVISLDMHVQGLVPIARVEEEAIPEQTKAVGTPTSAALLAAL